MKNKLYKDAFIMKAKLLHHGVDISKKALESYGYPYITKRRAYGNQDPFDIWDKNIPQEIYLHGSEIVSAVNIRRDSPIVLDYERDKYVVKDIINSVSLECSFPKHPKFYDEPLSEDKKLNQYITLYGGKSLATFVYGSCSLVDMKKACEYCSIQQNRSRTKEYDQVVRLNIYEKALRKTLSMIPEETNQIMINGGNFPDLDKNFNYYISFAKKAELVRNELGIKTEIHLIVYPPKNLKLLEMLNGMDISISMNTEVYDPDLFKLYCPGKAVIAGRDHTFKALKEASHILGKGRVYSILVGGLESLESLSEGMNHIAEIGATPVVNVFHPDPGTPLENKSAPSIDHILEMGRMLQLVYENNTFMKPFYMNCGRNSLDTEAFMRICN